MKNSKCRVYGFVPYDRSGKVNWTLSELGVDYEWIKLDYEKGENATAKHLVRNPMGAIPVIEMDGITMHESDAICYFLAERFPAGNLLPDAGTPARAECLQWLHFTDSTLGFAKMVRWPFLQLPEYPADAETADGKSAAEIYANLKKDSEEGFHKTLKVLDTHLGKRDYLCGSFTVADIALAYSLYWTESRGDLKNYPALTAYLARNKARPAAQKSEVFTRKDA